MDDLDRWNKALHFVLIGKSEPDEPPSRTIARTVALFQALDDTGTRRSDLEDTARFLIPLFIDKQAKERVAPGRHHWKSRAKRWATHFPEATP